MKHAWKFSMIGAALSAAFVVPQAQAAVTYSLSGVFDTVDAIPPNPYAPGNVTAPLYGTPYTGSWSYDSGASLTASTGSDGAITWTLTPTMNSLTVATGTFGPHAGNANFTFHDNVSYPGYTGPTGSIAPGTYDILDIWGYYDDPATNPTINGKQDFTLIGSSSFFSGVNTSAFPSLDFSQVFYGQYHFTSYYLGTLVGSVSQDPPLHYADGVLSGPGMAVDVAGVAALAPVPEPETYALMMAGLGVLGVVARRRKGAQTIAAA